MREILLKDTHLKLLLDMMRNDTSILSNIGLYRYEVLAYVNNSKKPTKLTGIVALNKQFAISLQWQAEYYLMYNRGVTSFEDDNRVILKEIDATSKST